MPDEAFWEAYAMLWNESIMRSVFQSPNYIRMLGTVYRNDLAVCRYGTTDGQLKGAIFFRKEDHAYRFLSDLKSDHNFIVFHNTITPEETADFFHRFFEEIKKELVADPQQPPFLGALYGYTGRGRPGERLVLPEHQILGLPFDASRNAAGPAGGNPPIQGTPHQNKPPHERAKSRSRDILRRRVPG
ncbi:MAG: hypothetical protein IPK76_18525 [Lewinellaceae bacterium]|nr:hypothetical protein [Lewinellaceae bacterium]